MTRFNVISFLIALSIVIAGSYFRLYSLGNIPEGLYSDEVSYAYNAYSIEQTGKDEWGMPTPLFLKAFGDYKPALLSYMQIVSFRLWGHTSTAVRFPSAVLGILSLIAVGFIFLKATKNRLIALVGMTFLAVSPWHIHYSRAALDPIVGFSFLLFGISFLMMQKSFAKFVGILFLIVSMYTYNAERAFIPLFGLVLLFVAVTNKNWQVRLKKFRVHVVVLVLAVFGFVAFSILSPYNSRAVSIIALNYPDLNTQVNDIFFRTSVVGIPTPRIVNNKLILAFQDVSKRYISHFSPMFLFYDGNLSPRHGFTRYGNLLLVTLPFFLFGIFNKLKKPDDFTWLMIIWLLLAPIPAAMSSDVPHSGRTLLMILPIIFFTCCGVREFVEKITINSWRIGVFFLVYALVLFNTILYWRDYLIYYPEESQNYWDGNVQTMVNYLSTEKDKSYKNIYATFSQYNQELFFAWGWKVDPRQWQAGQGNHNIDNMQIMPMTDTQVGCLLLEENSLIVTNAEDSFTRMASPNKILTSRNRFFKPPDLYYIFDTNRLNVVNPSLVESNCQSFKSSQKH